ncbi:MAG: hypothetical protein AAFX06_29330 [Planctomycetota bacterium]
MEPGTQITLTYPIQTHVAKIRHSPRQLRKLRIEKIRDLLAEPLTADEFMRRPFTNRSRWLALARDQQSGKWRQFYLGSADEFRSPATLQLLVVDPAGEGVVCTIGRLFEPNVRDRQLIVRLIERWNNQDHGDYELRIACADVRLVG